MITDISICFQAKTFPTRSSLWWRRSAGICFTCWLTSTVLTLKRRWLWSCRDTWTHCTHISSSSSGNSTWSTPRRPASWTTCRRCCAPPCRPTHTTTWPRDEDDDDEPCDASPSVTISHDGLRVCNSRTSTDWCECYLRDKTICLHSHLYRNILYITLHFYYRFFFAHALSEVFVSFRKWCFSSALIGAFELRHCLFICNNV